MCPLHPALPPSPLCTLAPWDGEWSWCRGNCGSCSRWQGLTLWLQWSLARDSGALPSGGAEPPSPCGPSEEATIPPLLCLQLFLFHTVTLRSPHNFTQCTTLGSFPQPWHETLYNMLGFACLFLLPLLIMICCYARILLEISRRMGSSLCECLGISLPCPRAQGALQGPRGEERRGEAWLGLCGEPPALLQSMGSLSQPGH